MSLIKCIPLKGIGGGASSGAKVFSPSRLGSNPRMDLGFFQFRFAINLLSVSVGLAMKNMS